MSSKTEELPGDAWKALLLTTFVVAAALRFLGLQSGLWYDEIVTLVLSVRYPLRQIVMEFPGVNEHPFYSVLAHVSIGTFGESAWALRLPACMFGIASVVMVYVLGAQLISRLEAWAAAAVLATSYHHIWFSQNARGYTLMGFLALLSVYLLLRAGRTGRRVDYVAYALVCATGIYTHLTMVFVVLCQAAIVLVARAFRWRVSEHHPVSPLLWSWAAVVVLSATAYAPVIGTVAAVINAEAPNRAAQVATASWALGETIRSLLSGAGVPAALAAAAFAVVGAVAVCRRQPLAFAMLTSPVVLTAVVMIALRQPVRPRFFFFVSGAAAIFVGRGIGAVVQTITPARTTGRPRAATAAVVMCVVALATLSAASLPRNYQIPKQDFDGAVRFLDAAELQGAEIVASGPACLPLAIYYDRKLWPCLTTISDWRDISQAGHRVLVAHTLTDYVDPELRERLRVDCPTVQRFEGTLGGGDITVCQVP